MKKIIAAILALALLPGIAGSAFTENGASLSEGERKALESLAEQQEQYARKVIAANGEVTDLYPGLPAGTPADTDSFPEKFDLRERGVITQVKNQAPWGTCWTFGTSAACESSLLTMLGLTAEGFRQKNGVDMDLSELHLAWFTATALPEVSDYPEGEYPYDPSQAGEGARSPEGKPILRMGGTYLLSASSLAAGVGVAAESIAPYRSHEGTLSHLEDWSVPEQYRFVQSFELKQTNVLPCPAGEDADGGYVYRPEGTAAIKRELLKGRGVAAAYLMGDEKPEMPSEERRALYEMEAEGDLSAEDQKAIVAIRMGELDAETLPDEQLQRIIEFRCSVYGIDPGCYAFLELSHEDLALLAGTNLLGSTPEEIRASLAAYDENRRLFFIGEDPVTWAQYMNKKAQPNHATCIVGWDDTFPAASFPEGHRPPADGAWICRNSYSEEWGMGGYFYLSYYDRSLGMCQTFEFVDDGAYGQLEHFSILQYDYMPAEMINATLFDEPVYAANVFTAGEEEMVLRHVSALTGCMNTRVTASVWLLEEGASSPTDGRLLSTVTETFEYAGYHRMTLPESLLLPAGSSIGITVLQAVPEGDKVKYALVNTSSQGENSPQVLREKEQWENSGKDAEENPDYTRWFVGAVNPGESYVSFEEGRWLDWRTVLDSFTDRGSCACLAYDNLPVKGYLYLAEEILAAHDLDTRIPAACGTAAICPDCGFVLEFVGR